MTHYMGSKQRHAKDIVAITTANIRPDQVYVEPFVGGGNVICQVPQGAGRIANDKNYAMVSLLHALGNLGWTPPETMTKSEWQLIMKKENDLAIMPVLEQALFAFAATGPTFGSMWAGAWAKDDDDKPKGTRYRQARDAALEDAPGLRGIKFHGGSFDAFAFPDRSLIYCDPPYVNTTEYEGSKVTIKVGESLGKNNWRAAKFWKWCDMLVDARGCDVFVSEYRGPAAGDVYGKIWTQELTTKYSAQQAAHRALQADITTTRDAFEASFQRIQAIEEEASAEGLRLAARWRPVWSKEVVSDFSASRGKEGEENAAKRETEYLFHREG